MTAQKGFALISILIAIVIFFLLGVGAFYIINKQNQKVMKLVLENIQPTSSVHESTSSAETANWKTYDNDKLGFTFKYPADHTVYSEADQKKPALIPATPTSDTIKIAENEEMVFCCEPATLSLSIKTTSKNAREWTEEYLNSVPEWKEELPIVRDLTFAGKPAVQAIGRGGYGPPYKLIVIPVNDLLLTITQNMDNPFFNQILSTFRFTN